MSLTAHPALHPILLVVLAGCAHDNGPRGVAENGDLPEGAVRVANHAFRPEKREVTPERVGQLRLQQGFRIQVFASDVGHARMLAVGPDGTVYVTNPNQARVMALRDDDGDGRADEVRPALEGLPDVHGIHIDRDTMYLASSTVLWRVRLEGGHLGQPEVLADDLPDGGQHPNRTLAVGPDEKLYISIGSTCNACAEPNPEHATIVRAELDGRNRKVFANGLRNTVGFGWHPTTRVLWGLDHGSDERGNDIPPEELNRIEEGKHYGWPYAYGKREVDPMMGPPSLEGVSKEEFAEKTEPAVLLYQAHAAPMAMVFYEGTQFPERYRGGAFAPMRGSWNRFPAVGYEVVHVRFEDGEPVEIEPFITGFLIEDGKAHFGRLAGIAVHPDGSLLFSDDANGVVYRVSYRAEAAAR